MAQPCAVASCCYPTHDLRPATGRYCGRETIAILVLACVAVAADIETVTEFDAALRPHGIKLAASTLVPEEVLASGSSAVVILSERSVADPVFQACVEALATATAIELFPVSTVTGRFPLLPDITHVQLPLFGVERAAERVAIVTKTGAANLASWLRLRQRAASWAAGGKPVAVLMSPNELDEANALLLRPIGRIAGEQPDLAEFLKSSRVHDRRRRRHAVTIGAIVTACLTVVSTVAVVQRQTANRQAKRAESAARASEADRLLAFASDEIDRDPDMPWLLVNAALRSDPSPRVRAAAVGTLSQLIPHQTFDLPVKPIAMSASASNRVALVAFDQRRVDVVDGSSGRVIGTHDRDGPIGDAALSPNGNRLALAVAGRLEIVDVATGSSSAVAGATGVRVAVWRSDDELAFLVTGRLKTVHTPSASPRLDLEVSPSTDVLAIGLSGKWIATGDDGGVTLFDADGTVRGSYAKTGVLDIEPGPADAEVLLRISDGLARVPLEAFSSPPADSATPTEIKTAVRVLAPSPAFPLPTCATDGTIGVITNGTVAEPRRFPAHQGACTGVGVLPDGSWVSAGADGRMRHWDTKDLDEVFVEGSAYGPFVTQLQIAIDNRESSRNLLVAAPGTDLATATSRYGFSAGVVHRAKPKVEQAGGIGLLDSPVRPSATAGRGVRFAAAAAVVQTWDIVRQEGRVLPAPPVKSLASQTAVSPNGDRVAVADGSAINVLDTTAQSPTWRSFPYDTPDVPVSVDIDDQGHAAALFVSGRIRRTDGPASTQLAPAGLVIAAGRSAPGGRTVLVSRDGQVFAGDQGTVARHGSVPGDLKPMGVDIAPDGRLAAVVGWTRTEVVALDAGLLVHVFASESRYRAVSDVAFDDDGAGALFIRVDGSISRVDFIDPGTVDQLAKRRAPRSLTADEVDMFDVGRPVE